jgi:MOSC domain-containing protein YiiM
VEIRALKHLTNDELQAGLDEIRQSPRDGGTVEMIVRRPRLDERELLAEGRLDPAQGLVGDYWQSRDGARPDRQITLMNARLIALVAQGRERWSLAGDQLYVDLDLSVENLPPGTRLAVGGAVLEVSAAPHTGCEKFMARFGRDAVLFVNSPEGKALRLRGMNARVVQPGVVLTGDAIRKI